MANEGEQPVAVFGSDRLAEELQSSGFSVSRMAEPADLRSRQPSGLPRLVVIEAGYSDDLQPAGLVQLSRSAMPLTDVLVWSPRGTTGRVRELFRAGAKDVVTTKTLSQVTAFAKQIMEEQQILPKVQQLEKQRSRSSKFESMLSRSTAMWDLFEQCSRVAAADATILIIGETGTGKELLARAIHRRSGREGRFVACNCASISEQLIESELFGHAQGAFTGAIRAKKGLARHAHQGTLFLDEIGDMGESVQVSLLRLLQEKTVRPVGGHEEIPVDLRIVAATNVPLDDAVAAGTFREDLFYRLDVIRLSVPPLRERPEDVVFLFGCFLRKLKHQYGTEGPELTDSFLDELAAHDWPGNVRQLENVVERVVLSQRRRPLLARDLRRMLRQGPAVESTNGPTAESKRTTGDPRIDLNMTLAENLQPVVENLERNYLEELLRQNNGRVAVTAEQAGISRRTLLRKLRMLKLDKADYR